MRSNPARLISPAPVHVLDAILRTDFVSFIRKVFQTVSPGEAAQQPLKTALACDGNCGLIRTTTCD